MKTKLLFLTVVFNALTACNHENHNDHNNDKDSIGQFIYTTYGHGFEIFIESDPLIAGSNSEVLTHITITENFKPLEHGIVTISLNTDEHELSQTLNKPDKPGIYIFDIKPEKAGMGTMGFQIALRDTVFDITIPGITVYATIYEAKEALSAQEIFTANTVNFTKEQSWLIDFATGHPTITPFGEIIKTTALIKSMPGDEVLLVAKNNGIVKLSTDNIIEGADVQEGKLLFSVLGHELAKENFSVRFIEIENTYLKAKANYSRIKELAEKKIVSQKDLLEAKNDYYNAKAMYDNLTKHFDRQGERVISPINGYIKSIYIANGSYVTTGQPLATVSQNRELLLTAQLPQKHLSTLRAITSANLRTLHDAKVYTFNELNGRILSVGQSADATNFLIPVNIKIDNTQNFIPGSFVELFLKATTNSEALTVPNSALIEEQGIFSVYVQIHPELFEKRNVEIGRSDGILTEIKEGLSSDETIVTKGAIIVKLAQAVGSLDAHSGHVH